MVCCILIDAHFDIVFPFRHKVTLHDTPFKYYIKNPNMLSKTLNDVGLTEVFATENLIKYLATADKRKIGSSSVQVDVGVIHKEVPYTHLQLGHLKNQFFSCLLWPNIVLSFQSQKPPLNQHHSLESIFGPVNEFQIRIVKWPLQI